MPLVEDADSVLVIPQVVVVFDKDDSWLTSLRPSACVEKTHAFSPGTIFLPNEKWADSYSVFPCAGFLGLRPLSASL